jgi:cephalosporin-C deacetylase
MDCIRTVDFIQANEELGFDLKRIGVFGGSQGAALALMVSGLLGNKIQTCMVDNPTFCDHHLNFEMQDQIRGESFVLSSFKRYLDENKTVISKEDLLNTLSYYEIQNFVPKIKASVLFGIGLLDPLAPAATTIGAYNKLNPEVIKKSEIYIFPTLAHEVPERHNTFKSIWFYEKLAKGKK